jgi:small subunit ribosomal protein S16
MRMGKKKQPTYRVVAADSRSPRNGRFIEIVGIYDPRPDPSAIRIDNDKAVDWLRKGAQPTEPVRKLLEISGAWETYSGTPSTRPAPAPKVEKAEKPAPAPEPEAAAPADEPTEAEAAADADAGDAAESADDKAAE